MAEEGGDVEQRPEQDAEWDARQRGETPMERLDRNWADLLQELRVVQTGVQLLTGFLLTLPFQSRFTTLSGYQQGIYLATVALSVGATGLLIAPVALHRGLFRRHARRVMVTAAHRFAVGGMALLGLSVTGVVLLTFDVVRGTASGVAAAALCLVLLAALWLAMPLALRDQLPDEQDDVRSSG